MLQHINDIVAILKLKTSILKAAKTKLSNILYIVFTFFFDRVFLLLFLRAYFCISCRCRRSLELNYAYLEVKQLLNSDKTLYSDSKVKNTYLFQSHVILASSKECCAIWQELPSCHKWSEKMTVKENIWSYQAKALVRAIFIRARVLHIAFKIAYILKISVLEARKMSQSLPWV